MSIARSTQARRFFWAHPEWWSLTLAGAAWVAMLFHALPDASAHHAHAHAHAHHSNSFPNELLWWCLMVLAMMVPLMLEPLRWVVFQSYRHRRHQAMAVFLIGFLLPWALVGVLVAWLRTFGWSAHPLIAPVLFGLAAVWALVPLRKRALVFCHRTEPLAPSGWKADRDCTRFGLHIGVSCVATCLLVMLGCAFTGHSLIAMIGGTALAAVERLAFRPPVRPVVLGSLLLAGVFLLPLGL